MRWRCCSRMGAKRCPRSSLRRKSAMKSSAGFSPSYRASDWRFRF